MFIEGKAADPAVHMLAVAIAQDCLRIIRGCIRDDEAHDAQLEFYKAARRRLEEAKGGRGWT